MSETDENVNGVMDCSFANPEVTVCEVANMLGISFGSVQEI
jgi:hypothetical protein